MEYRLFSFHFKIVFFFHLKPPFMFLISRAQRVGLFQYLAGSGQVLNKIQVAGGYLIYFRVLLGVLGISGYLGCAGYFGDFDFDDFQN